MTAFDYFLYDNRTPSISSGRDWNIKAATGALAGRRDLRIAFQEYCRLSHGDNKHPRDFDAAIGGLRGAGQGYLVCVTLETPDGFLRPSLAIVGLWCPDRDVLATLIGEGDPIETARPLLKLDRPPANLEMRGTSRRGRTLKPRDKTAYLRFRKGESAELALSMLDRAGVESSLPSILGITGSSKLTDAAKKGFQVIFSRPADALAEEVLARLETSPAELAEREPPVIVASARKPIVGRGLDPPELPMVGEPATERARGRRRSSAAASSDRAAPRRNSWIVPTVIVASLIVAAVVSAPFVIDGRQDQRGDERSSGQTTNAATGQSPEMTTEHDNPRKALERSLSALKALQPGELRKSPGFLAAEHVDVIPERIGDRKDVQHAYSVLLENQQYLLSPGFRDSLDFALTDRIRNAPDKESRLARLRESAGAGVPACETLRRTFGDELSLPTSVAHRWCEAFESLNKAVQSLDFDGPRGS